MLKYKTKSGYKQLKVFGSNIPKTPEEKGIYARKNNQWINLDYLYSLELNLIQLTNKIYNNLEEVLLETIDDKYKVKGIKLLFQTQDKLLMYIYKGDIWNNIDSWQEIGKKDLNLIINLTLNVNVNNIKVNYLDKSETYNYIGEILTFKIPINAEYSIIFPELDGYIKPENITGIANLDIKQISIEYTKIPENIITINQTISDPETMVGGDVNGEVIQWIRANSHRVLAKKIAEGKVTYCRLKDDDGTKYHDGSTANLTGTEGDVFVKLPTFYYYGTEGNNVELHFAKEKVDDNYIEWDSNILIGVYESVMNGNKAYSKSGVESTRSVPQADWKRYAKARGTGYQLVDWQMHCVLGCLYYAMYGNTNCQATIGAGTDSYQKINGQTDALGMTDTKASTNGNSQSINFWGLENWWGNKYEWMEEDNIGANMSTYDPVTKGSRDVAVPDYTGYYPKKMKFGKYLDLIARSDDPKNGGDSVGYCDYQYWNKASTARVVLRSGNNSYSGGGVAFADASVASSYAPSYFGSRLAFRGECTEEINVSTFKSLPLK